jgi:predicted SPOUT superfamily RNA methylase MTH1
MNTHRRKSRLSVGIPASVVSEYANIREKTEVLGRIARSLSLFRAEEAVIYPDYPDESNLIKLILGYVETPQYLRKHLYRVRPELQYAGAIPPLRTPHHQLAGSIKELKMGEFREGVLFDSEGVNVVDIGVEKNIRLVGRAPSHGSRVTVKVIQKNPEMCELAKRREIPYYWGYEIQVSKKSIGEISSSKYYDLRISTSRTGDPIKTVSNELKSKWTNSNTILIVFGSPQQGILDIVAKGDKRTISELFDFNVNTIPNQGCETVRVEEAIHATLAIFNLFDE